MRIDIRIQLDVGYLHLKLIFYVQFDDFHRHSNDIQQRKIGLGPVVSYVTIRDREIRRERKRQSKRWSKLKLVLCKAWMFIINMKSWCQDMHSSRLRFRANENGPPPLSLPCTKTVKLLVSRHRRWCIHTHITNKMIWHLMICFLHISAGYGLRVSFCWCFVCDEIHHWKARWQ